MKNIKVFCAILALTAMFAMPTHAQTRVVSGSSNQQGNTTDLGGVYPTGGTVTPSDSLQVSDSIAYFVSMIHTATVDPFITWYWDKIGSGNPTVTLSFLESNDNVNWFAIPKGSAQTAYTKTFSPTANTWYEVNFRADTALFSAKYLKIYYITGATASTKGKIFTRLKTSIK